MANDEEGRAEHGAKEQTKRSAGGTNWWRIRLGRLIWAQHRTYGSSSEVHEVDAGSGCRTSPEPWTKLWLSISVVVVLLTAGMVSGCGRGDESNGKNDGNTEQKQAADAEQKRLANIEHNRLAQISLRYWQSLDQIGCPIPGSRRDSNALAEGEEAAKKIEAMSVSEVDPEIINFARDTAQLCRRWGQFVDDHYSSSALAGRFFTGALYGLGGDFTGGAKLDSDIEKGRCALIADANTLQSEATALRAVLSQKYGIEFPALHFKSE